MPKIRILTAGAIFNLNAGDEITVDHIPDGWKKHVITLAEDPAPEAVAVTNPAAADLSDMKKPDIVAALEATGWPGDLKQNKPELAAALAERTADLAQLQGLGWTGDPAGKDHAALAAEVAALEALKSMGG